MQTLHRLQRRAVTCVLAVVLVAGLAAAARGNDLSEDLKARRARVMERLGPDAMLIMWSAPVRTYSADVSYEYRQDSNLYYLTGITQPNTMLVVMPGNTTRREILFVQDKDPFREHWNGRILTTEEAASRSGVATVLSNTQFDAFVTAMLGRRPSGVVDEKEARAFSEALAAGRAKLALVHEARSTGEPLDQGLEFARRLRDRFTGFQTVDVAPLLADLRMVKTPYERAVLIKSLEISNDAQKAGMRTAKPGVWEYQVEAAIESVFMSRGSVSWSYPSIVGSGPNATILHYTESSRQMQAGELLLVDAATNFDYMSGDITRTYPISGRFSPVQKDIYEVVFEAQEEGIKVASAKGSLLDIHRRTVEVVKAGLLKLGLITDISGDQYRMWYTHGACHFIGLDVHDVGDRSRPLVPGVAFVIEPGIYVRQSALDALPRTPENLALIQKIQPAVTKYLDIGVRIEDAFLMEDTGLRRLTAGVPRTIAEVEAFMTSRP
jgi:Xaa-Pro aminopeptidase